MESFFIHPSSLPGGHEWAEACRRVPIPQDGTAEDVVQAQFLRESLGCASSPWAGFVQVLFLVSIYGSILFYASNMIATGSELLLLIKSLRNVVGSVVLPILGAVPDGAIVLFSAMGPNAQEEVAIGVGALAGSTIMLLTIPWFLSILAGRVNIRSDGVAMYRHKPRLWVTDGMPLTRTGVEPKGMVQTAGRYMLLTSISYVVIQSIALFAGSSFVAFQTKASTAAAASSEHYGAMFVLAVCSSFFAYYLFSQFSETPEKTDNQEAMLEHLIKSRVADKSLSLTAAFDELWTLSVEQPSESSGLVDIDQKRLKNVLKYFFHEFDHDNNGFIDSKELGHLMVDLGERLTEVELQTLHEQIDADRSGTISLDEFQHAIPQFIRARASNGRGSSVAIGNSEKGNGVSMIEEGSAEKELSPANGEKSIDAHEDSDEEEVPEDLKHEDPHTERRRILLRAFGQMVFGTVLVLIFSDPMVGVMSETGKRLNISPFYISFALAPLASNASEVIAAYNYAKKKTRRTVTISFSTLLGAAILNNTFVLGIFMVLIVAKGLAWQFTAETVSILFVEVAIGLMSQKKVQTMRDGLFVLSLYPASLFIVAFLENVVGLD